MATLRELLWGAATKGGTDWGDVLVDKAKQERENAAKLAVAEKTKENAKNFQQAVIVDPKSGQSVMGIFNPASGEYKPSEYRRGYAPSIDPELGLKLPSDVVQSRGLQGLQKANVPSTNTSGVVDSSVNIQPNERVVTPESSAQTAMYQAPPVAKKALEARLKALDSIETFKTAKRVLKEGPSVFAVLDEATVNPMALSSARGTLSRMYETGVMTENDFTKYLKDPSFAGQAKMWFTEKRSGTLPPYIAEGIKKVLAAKMKEAALVGQDAIGKEAKTFNMLYKMPEGYAARVLGGGEFDVPAVALPYLKQVQEQKNRPANLDPQQRKLRIEELRRKARE